jgi:DNA modification methylase
LLLHGDCLDLLRTLDADSIDAIVTDPPYGLSFMGKRWDYDVPSEAIWRECLRVLKPGGHLLAFAGTRTQHRMAVRIEDAGFEIRDMIAWVYGSGFPKSHNGPWGGTALKPALEPITVARKPLEGTVAANVLAHGTGGLNIDGCRVAGPPSGLKPYTRAVDQRESQAANHADVTFTDHPAGRWPANLIHDGSEEVLAGFPQTTSGKGGGAGMGFHGGKGDADIERGYGDTGSAARFFKSCQMEMEDWLLQQSLDQIASAAASPSSACETSIAATVAETKSSAFNSGASPVIPASIGNSSNCTPNHSPAPADQSENTGTIPTMPTSTELNGFARPAIVASTNLGSAEKAAAGNGPVTGMRFLYQPKASKKDRDEGLDGFEAKPRQTMGSGIGGQPDQDMANNKNFHPTVKPTDLMRYLCRLVTPPGGTVLDPFMGSGSTGKAARLEGFQFIGIERDADYFAIAQRRIAEAKAQALFCFDSISAA